MLPYLEKSDWWLHANTMTDRKLRRIHSYETHRKLFTKWSLLCYDCKSHLREHPSRLKLASIDNGRLSRNRAPLDNGIYTADQQYYCTNNRVHTANQQYYCRSTLR